MHKKTVIDFKALGQRLVFTQPLVELKTRDVSEVKDLLAQVESYQQEGYYVVGYVSYEAAPAFEEKLQVHEEPLLSEYLLYFTVHAQVAYEDFPLTYEEVAMPDKWQQRVSEVAYEKAIETIHHHIRQGDTYQVNYTIQLEQDLTSQPWEIYNRLVVEQEAAYNAYIEHDDFAVLSISPELFFEQEEDWLKTRPMKGTIARGVTKESDLAAAAWLTQDSKNRAENMMIVDLLRNDMNRICRVGTVAVDKLCTVEQYSTVWQMTSTIVGQLKSGLNLPDLFQALFPCGSITGAPKISTMGYIKQLESAPRGVYCGTVGICLPDGHRIFNVAIRSLQIQQGKAIYGVGGGITWDSSWQGEYQEVAQKSAILTRQRPRFDLVTTGRVTGGQLTFADQHQTRLQEATRYFAYPFEMETWQAELQAVCTSLSKEVDYRLRMTVDKAGHLGFEVEELRPLSADFLSASLVEQSANLAQPFTYFKTSHRPHIQVGTREQIYHLPDGTLLETSLGNLLLEIEGQLYTPVGTLPILKGIYRKHLLDTNQAREAHLTLPDLERASRIYACNAVRGLYEIKLEK